MARYTLYYWSVPFRGQFVRATLAFAGQGWTEAGDDAIARLMDGPVKSMPVPFMGPPVLVDHQTDVAIAQMPAIILYLGETLTLMPVAPGARALTMKVINDANDVIDELTLDGGRQMWTAARWCAFEPRLRKWMSFWEETGRRHGLTRDSGFLLGGDDAGLADVVSSTLWTTVADRFPALKTLLEQEAPMTAGLVHRVAERPALAALSGQAKAEHGEAWSGGQIEASLRKVLET